MLETDPAADLLGGRVHGRRPVDLGDVARRGVDDRAEMLADEFVGPEPGQALDRVGQERDPRIGADGPHDVGGVLDEEAVTLLGLAQLALEPLPVADVADRALGTDPAAVLEDPGGRDLGLERRLVAADQDQRHPLDEVGVGGDRRVRLERRRHRAGVGEEPERLADDVLDRPAEQRLAGIGHEREDALRVGVPDDIGRRLDQPTEARLLLGQAREQVGVRERDRRLIGQALEQVEVVGLEDPRFRGRDRQRADDVAARGAKRRGGHAAQGETIGHHLVVGLVGDARIGLVVEGPDGLAVLGRQAVDALTEREPHAHQPFARGVIAGAGHHDRHEVGPGRVHPGQVRAVGHEEALGILDDALQDLVGVGQGGDPRRDVAQRSFGLGPAGQGHPGALELVDETGIRDGDGGLLGETAEHRRVEVVEGVRTAAHDLDGAERSRLADDRRRDQVADAGPLDQRVGELVVAELALEIVPDVDDPALGHGLAGHALAEPQVGHLDRLALVLGQARVIGPLQRAALGVVLVDQGAIGTQQALGLVDHVLEHLVGLAQGRDPRRDLAQAGFRLCPPLDVLA